MEDVIEPGQALAKSAKMEDIPLNAVEEQEQQDAAAISKEPLVSKTGSLRRFFKMSQKKNAEAADMDLGKQSLDEQTDEAASAAALAEGDSEGKAEKKKSFHKRLNFRVGQALKSTSGAEEPVNAESKVTLKSSIAGYINNVFKRAKTLKAKKGKGTAGETNDNEQNAEAEPDEELETPNSDANQAKINASQDDESDESDADNVIETDLAGDVKKLNIDSN